MAMPPERITVKRRLDEDPVDTLYIAPKKHRASTIWKRANIEDSEPRYARSLAVADPLATAQTQSPTNRGIKSSDVTAATPNKVTMKSTEGFELYQDARPDHPKLSHARTLPSASTITRPFQSSERSLDLTKSGSNLRSFHLSKHLIPKNAPNAISKPGKHMQTKNERNNIAIFVEQTGRVTHSQGVSKKPALSLSKNGQDISMSEPQRRQIAVTPEERKWTDTNRTQSIEQGVRAERSPQLARSIDPFKKWDFESPELAEELQQIALQEIDADEQRRTHITELPQLKSKPKPPKPRQSRIKHSAKLTENDVDMLDSNEVEDHDIYVFDTYVRSTAQLTGVLDSSESYADPLNGVSHGSIGILVIDEDEEHLWETHGEMQQSEPEWDSDEEDENAEDYYGNDYPEDEVNSDDEFNRGAYNYRHDASDDEEYDEETVSWSDADNKA